MQKNKTQAESARAYRAQAQAAADPNREADLMQYLPLVKYIAGRIAIGLPKSVELDDLIDKEQPWQEGRQRLFLFQLWYLDYSLVAYRY